VGDAFDPEPQGAFLSALDWMDRLSGPFKNALRGNFAGAGRQTVDLLGDVVDAALPGDWINHIAQPDDEVDPSDLLGIDKEQSPFLAGTTDFVGNILLNPSTYVPAGLIAKGVGAAGKGIASVAAKGAAMLPEAAQPTVQAAKKTLEEGGRLLRRTAGAERVLPATEKARQAAQAAYSTVKEAGLPAYGELLKGATAADRNAIGQIGHNIRLDPVTGRPIGMIDPTETLTMAERAEEFLKAAPEGVNPDRVRQAVAGIPGMAKTQFSEGQAAGRFYKAGEGATPGEGIKEYFPRQFSGLKEGDLERDVLGQPNVYKKRELTTKGVIDLLAEEPGVKLEFDAGKALGHRVEQEATLAQSAEAGKHLAGPEFVRASGDWMKNARKQLASLPPEDAAVMKDLLEGLPPRGPIFGFLAKAMKPFKQAAVYGAAIPRISTDVSNAVGSAWQTMSNAEARGQTGQMLLQVFPALLGAIDDGIEKVFGGRVGSIFGKRGQFAELEAAAKGSGGSVPTMLELIQDPTMKLAVKHGVIGNNMVTAEQMIAAASRDGGWKSFFGNWWDMPGVIFKGVEQRMRFALFKGLLKKHGADEAARIVGDTLYDYNISSVANRTARDIIPFWQYTAKAVPQQAKFLADKPAVAVGIAQLAGADPKRPIYPYMEGKLNVPIGEDEQGNDQYLTSFRLPFETLGSVPNPSADLGQFARQMEQSVVGSMNPVLKTGYSLLSGRDPYFGSQYGSYQKIPMFGDQGDVGQAYNQLAGTGLIQAVDSPLRYLNNITDERKSLPESLLAGLTGVRIASVDADRALQQQLQGLLESNPDVLQHRSFYQKAKDPETQELLEAYKEMRARVKAKKAASP
jgi:hypothetical protein